MVETQKEKQLRIIKDKDGKIYKIDQDDFLKVLGKFESKRSKAYDFFLKAGKIYQEATKDNIR